jgi:hypothetical protein
MKSHNASIYHCVSCGRIVHAELESRPPQCCGHPMAEVTETIHDGDAAEWEASGASEIEGRQQMLDARLKKLDAEVADLRDQGAEREKHTTTN